MNAGTLAIDARDVTGHRRVHAPRVPASFTVRELVRGLIEKMSLPKNDVEGHALDWQARLEREGRHLRGSETVGEALRPGDALVMVPDIDAGC